MNIRIAMLAALVAMAGMTSSAAELPPSPAEEPAAQSMPPLERGLLIEASELIGRGSMREAEPLVRRVLAASPDNRPARQLLMAILIELKRDREAAETFAAYYPEHLEDFQFLNNYAWFLVKAEDRAYRDPGRALGLAQDAILLAPEVYQVWSTLAEVRYMNGDFERAVKAMQQAIELASRQGADTERINNYRADLQRMLEAQVVMTLME